MEFQLITNRVFALFQRFIPISAFYPHFSVLFLFQYFIPTSAFYPYFSVLSSFQRFIPYFSVLFPFQRFSPISAFYPHFSFRFQFPFPSFNSAFYRDPARYTPEFYPFCILCPAIWVSEFLNSL